MQQLIETIVKPLVDYPEEVRIETDENTNRIVYKLFVHPEDRGKVIGKQGRVAKAIRTIVYSAAGSHRKKKTYVDILDD
ncbi:KH domain-containing protein [Metasolibacillus sp. FSL H7-0170]|uniref:KH domain-containing protein n=1 Tax=Metasolibacillus TaxID=2703677 RepID=UPI0007921A29|nr:KH domain-containing protein [Metasolibacillus fluoroglycofenilyticus]KYG89483.1 RNA-binding protein [[Bacillus] sp. KCTC 13219]